MQKLSVTYMLSFSTSCDSRIQDLKTNYWLAVTSAMRKNARWAGMNVGGLGMGSLGISMGLRKGQGNTKETRTGKQVRESRTPVMG